MTQDTELTPFEKKVNRIMTAMILFLWLMSFGLATLHNTWMEALVIGALIAAAPLLLMRTQPKSMATQCAVAIAFMMFTALHVHQGQGFIELHFGFFALLAASLNGL